MVKVDDAEEPTKLTLGSWLWIVRDDPDCLFQRTNAVHIVLMTQEL